jgi:hypothetical protein
MCTVSMNKIILEAHIQLLFFKSIPAFCLLYSSSTKRDVNPHMQNTVLHVYNRDIL